MRFFFSGWRQLQRWNRERGPFAACKPRLFRQFRTLQSARLVLVRLDTLLSHHSHHPCTCGFADPTDRCTPSLLCSLRTCLFLEVGSRFCFFLWFTSTPAKIANAMRRESWWAYFWRVSLVELSVAGKWNRQVISVRKETKRKTKISTISQFNKIRSRQFTKPRGLTRAN